MRGLRLLADLLQGDADRILAVKRQLAGDHLVHHYADRIEVGAAVDALFTRRLLGADVVDRADRLVGGGEGLGIRQLRNAEVGHLDLPAAEQHDVLRLDVAVDNAAEMRVLQRAQDLDGIRDGLLDGESALALHVCLERDAVDVFHDDIFVFALDRNIKDLDDVGVREHENGFGFVDEALHRHLVRRKLLLEDLDGDGGLFEQVIRLENHCHAADADQAFQAIAVVEDKPDIILICVHICTVCRSSLKPPLPVCQARRRRR